MLETIVATTFFFLAVSFWGQWRRSRRHSRLSATLELVPNCLLTQHPIVFLSGRKTVFYFLHYWNFIPQFLREHGYDVYELTLPWRDSRQRQACLANFLSGAEQPLHLVADLSARAELEMAWQTNPTAIASLTLAGISSELSPAQDNNIDSLTVINQGRRPDLFFRLHQLFSGYRQSAATLGAEFDPGADEFAIEQQYLDWARRRAEMDHQ